MKFKRIAEVISAAVLIFGFTGCSSIAPVQDPFTSSSNSAADNRDLWDDMPEISVTDASAFTYSYDSELGGMVIIDYKLDNPKVHIPEKLEGEPVVEVNLRSCEKEITELVMPDSVKSFELSTKIEETLQNINIPNSVTKIGFGAFEGCTSLTSITIPDSVTEIGSRAFVGCTSLTSITIPDSVTWIGTYVFSGCSSLASITISDSVKTVDEGAFEDCISLTSITIPNSVTLIGSWAFRGCTSLTSITIPNSVTEISDLAFVGCTSLISVTIPDSVTSINPYAFANCSSLSAINVADGNSKYFSIEGVLYWKDNETVVIVICPQKRSGSITIPDSVTAIGGYSFEGCTSITSITIPDSVTSIDIKAFNDCTSLTSITIPGSVTRIDYYAFNGCTSITSITIPDSVTWIGNAAFDGCINIKATYKGKTYDYAHIEDLYKAINGR